MITDYDVKKVWEITSVFDFIQQFKVSKEWLKKKFPDSPDDCVSSVHFDSDEDTINEWLKESKNVYTIDFIDNRHDGYWLIRLIKVKPKQYTKEDLKTDIDWLVGQGVDESEAETFIMNLLDSEWCEK